MNLLRTRSNRLLILLCLGILLVFARFPIFLQTFLHHLWIRPFLDPHHFVSNWRTRLAGGAVLCCVWVLIFGVLLKAWKSLQTQIHPTIAILSAIGWGVSFVLLGNRFGFHLVSTQTSILLYTPVGILTLLAAYRLKFNRQRPSLSPLRRIPYNTAIRYFLYVITVLIISRFLIQFLLLPLTKGLAQGDELANWWISENYMSLHGFSDYLNRLRFCHSPGYALLSSALLGPFPRSWIESLEPTLPFLFGTWFFSLFLFGRPKSRLSLGQFVFLGLLLVHLVFTHGWINLMMFEIWYSEAMAIILVAAALLSMDSIALNASRPKTFLALFGLGVLCQLGKPPLALLFIPAFLPALIGTKLFVEKTLKIRRETLFRGISLFCGALFANFLWKANLEQAGLVSIFDIPINSFLDFNWRVPVLKIIPYLSYAFRPSWTGFFVLAGIALVFRPKRYLPSLLASSGLIASIFVLYGTVWQQTEIQSAGRYMLHGAYGWMAYFLAMESKTVVRIMSCALFSIQRRFAKKTSLLQKTEEALET